MCVLYFSDPIFHSIFLSNNLEIYFNLKVNLWTISSSLVGKSFDCGSLKMALHVHKNTKKFLLPFKITKLYLVLSCISVQQFFLVCGYSFYLLLYCMCYVLLICIKWSYCNCHMSQLILLHWLLGLVGALEFAVG